MTIKNNETSATTTSTDLSGKAAVDKQSITYASESNLTAISTGKASSETGQVALTNYQDLLSADADKIGSLGKEFQAIDQKIAKSLEQYF